MLPALATVEANWLVAHNANAQVSVDVTGGGGGGGGEVCAAEAAVEVAVVEPGGNHQFGFKKRSIKSLDDVLREDRLSIDTSSKVSVFEFCVAYIGTSKEAQ